MSFAGRTLALDPGRLDQHLLTDDAVLARLVDAAQIGPDDVVLDPGAGPGTVSARAAGRAGKVVAVEIDPQFAPLLNDVRASHENITIILGDLFTTALPALDVVVGNPPFGAFEQLILMLGVWRPRVAALILGLRACQAITAPLGRPELGRVGILARAVFDIDLIDILAPTSFTPAARTPAGIVRMRRRVQPDPLLPVLADALVSHSGQRVRDFLWHLGSSTGPLSRHGDLIDRARGLRQAAAVESLAPKRLQALDRHQLALLVRELEGLRS